MLMLFVILAVYSIVPESGGYDYRWWRAPGPDRLTPATVCFSVYRRMLENF